MGEIGAGTGEVVGCTGSGIVGGEVVGCGFCRGAETPTGFTGFVSVVVGGGVVPSPKFLLVF